ncbi:unnamed protein product [Amoebophrya sp. A120]|nr:unnamed protein product [Amoebophrya sp. A120]|eukprot:GSA120T00002596001.1
MSNDTPTTGEDPQDPDQQSSHSNSTSVQSLRDLQHQKWLQKKEAAAAEKAKAAPPPAAAHQPLTGNSSASSSSSSSARPASAQEADHSMRSPKLGARSPVRPLRELSNPNAEFLRKVHILPLGQSQSAPNDMLQFLKPALSNFRKTKRVLYTGMVFEHNSRDFIVVKTDPEGGKDPGILGPDTEYYFTGPAVARFKRIQFSALTNVLRRVSGSDQLEEDEELSGYSTERLFQEMIAPYFQSHSDNEKTGGVFKLLNVNESITINGVQFVVMATDPEACYGIVDKDTLIFVDKDETPEYRRIHIVPFQDTLPRSYQYDVFNDYLKPYCKAHANQRYRVNDVFTYNAVQFKVVCCDPEELGGTNTTPGSGARIGRNTTVYCEGVLHPQLRDLLPPELVTQLAYLPPGLQMLLLSTDAVGGNQELFERLMEVQDMLQQRRGMSEETIANVEKVTIDKKKIEEEEGQLTCMVCLCDFDDGEEARMLPCKHTFHADCIDEWLRRSCECPICKHNVDRTIRQY